MARRKEIEGEGGFRGGFVNSLTYDIFLYYYGGRWLKSSVYDGRIVAGEVVL